MEAAGHAPWPMYAPHFEKSGGEREYLWREERRASEHCAELRQNCAELRQNCAVYATLSIISPEPYTTWPFAQPYDSRLNCCIAASDSSDTTLFSTSKT